MSTLLQEAFWKQGLRLSIAKLWPGDIVPGLASMNLASSSSSVKRTCPQPPIMCTLWQTQPILVQRSENPRWTVEQQQKATALFNQHALITSLKFVFAFQPEQNPKMCPPKGPKWPVTRELAKTSPDARLAIIHTQHTTFCGFQPSERPKRTNRGEYSKDIWDTYKPIGMFSPVLAFQKHPKPTQIRRNRAFDPISPSKTSIQP